MKKWIVMGVFVTLFSAASNAIADASDLKSRKSKKAVGKPVENYTFYINEQDTTTFESLKGEPTLVYFFASWCTPCYSALENIEKVLNTTSPSINFVAVSLDDDWIRLNRMLDKTGYSGTVWRASEGKKVLRKWRFANYQQAIPYTIAIDAEGILAEHSYNVDTSQQWYALLTKQITLSDLIIQ